MKFLFVTFVLFVAGCASKPAPVVKLPLAETVPVAAARIAPAIGHYTLGAYVDPDNDLVRHEAHAIQRVETDARWDLRPAVVEPTSVGEELPEAAEAEAHAGAGEPVPVPAVEVPAVSAAEPAVVVPSRASVPASERAVVPILLLPAPAKVSALMPNADGVVDLATTAEEGNPFVVRAGALPAREFTVAVAGVVHGPAPCALVNGQSVEPGDRVEALAVVQVETDAVLFSWEGLLVRLPVAAKPVRVKGAL